MGLFLDLIHVPVKATNDMLEGLYKALSDGHNHGDDGIWKPHQSLLIRRLIELFTKRGLDRLETVKTELLAWKSGQRHAPTTIPVPQPPGTMQRWTGSELALVRLYLESLPPAQWSLDDHMMAIEYVVQTYMPADAMKSEAEWLATKAGLMGKVQANLSALPTISQADAILAALPNTLAGAMAQFKLSHNQVSSLEFSNLRSAENVRALSDNVRHRMRQVIAADLEQRAYGNTPPGTSSLETKLFDEFGTLNRDWRRIAITEAGEANLQGYIASLEPGTKVKRVEMYDDACAFCRKINGTIVTVVAADAPNKNPDTEVWPGKNNIGRSASPRKRVGNVLMEREPHEMWVIPAGLVHPNCRGRWVPVIQDQPGDDPAFGDWLRATLGAKPGTGQA